MSEPLLRADQVAKIAAEWDTTGKFYPQDAVFTSILEHGSRDVAALCQQDARWRALVGGLLAALTNHQCDACRPCATCQASASVLTQAQAALDGA